MNKSMIQLKSLGVEILWPSKFRSQLKIIIMFDDVDTVESGEKMKEYII